MEPPREEQPKVPAPRAEPRPKRFCRVKLEERIAPGGGYSRGNCYGGYSHNIKHCF
jgi:hypothetical protein